MNQRHRSRRLAVQGLCCLDAQGSKARDLVLEFVEDSRESPEVATVAREMLLGAFERRQETDRLLARHARHWDLSRLAMVDRNILRLAVHELLSGQTPPKVAITEAIKLAKEFSSAESPRFVNGVLDAVVRELFPAVLTPPRRRDEPPTG